ncbi:MAG: dephospho-CoA kinase [Geminicoccaceae bacterium]
MILLGLTGSIAMGKSRAAERFRAFGVPVFDSDAQVHAMLSPGGAAVAPVAAAFPGCLSALGGIDRPTLGRMVFDRPAELRRLELIVHPLVRAARDGFLRRACRAGADLVVLDVPLLYETHGDRRVDAVAVVWASSLLQRQRALRRPGMTPEKLARIRSEQLPDAWKRRHADFVIPSGHDGGVLAAHVGAIITALRHRTPRAWPPHGSGASSAISARDRRPSLSRSKVNQRRAEPAQSAPPCPVPAKR